MLAILVFQRTLNISGSSTSIEQAKKLVEEVIEKQKEKVAAEEADGKVNNHRKGRILLPASKVGSIIGSKGSKLRELQKDSNTRIVLFLTIL